MKLFDPINAKWPEREVRLGGWGLLAALLLLPLSSITASAQEPGENLPQAKSAQAATGNDGLANQGPIRQAGIDLSGADPVTMLAAARVVYVRSTSLLVGASVVEDKLRQRREFQQLGLLLTREPANADLVLELRHDVFTMYVFTAIDPKTKLVVASGKLSSLGGTVAGKVAERFLKQLVKARQQIPKPG